jgi:hypothetical protein
MKTMANLLRQGRCADEIMQPSVSQGGHGKMRIHPAWDRRGSAADC